MAVRSSIPLILRRGKGRFNGRLPDGFDNLAAHNLVTFKSHHEALDDWALKELTGHYVNYRKQLSLPGQPLLPEREFRLYAVCSLYPHNLAHEVDWQELQSGVYQCRRGTDAMRVVVAGQLAEVEHNAPLHLFSAEPAGQHPNLIPIALSIYYKDLSPGRCARGLARWRPSSVPDQLPHALSPTESASSAG